MKPMTRLLFAGAAALLLAACGSDEAVNNAAGPDINAAAGIPLGNDASAMEIVGNQGGSMAMPAPGEGNEAAASGNRSGSGNSSSSSPRPRERSDETDRSRAAPPPAADRDDSPPGGDRGGNAAQGNVSGI